jgi:hypothetical protein
MLEEKEVGKGGKIKDIVGFRDSRYKVHASPPLPPGRGEGKGEGKREGRDGRQN